MNFGLGERKLGISRENPDGFQFVPDVPWDVVRDLRDSDAVVLVALGKTREHSDLLPESDPPGHGSLGGWVEDPESDCLDPRGALVHRARRHRHVRC